MPNYSDGLTIKTEIGDITAQLSLVAQELQHDLVSFRALPITPKLPPNMSVKQCTLLLLIIEGAVDIEGITIDLSFETTAVGTPCTGQFLDAQEWSENGKLVVVGTEDGEALNRRFPDHGLEDQVVTIFHEQGMTLSLGNLGRQVRPSVHILIAENNVPEPVDASAWFAVDQDHSALLGK